MDKETAFFNWFENDYSGDAVDGSRNHSHLQEAFDAGAQYAKDEELEKEGKRFRKNQETIGYP